LSRNSQLERLLILGTIWMAAALRWMQPALVAYSYDEAHITGMAQGIARLNGYFPLLSGGTSLGVQRSAFDAYLLAVPLFLGGHVEAAVLGLGALGVVAVALTYALGRRVERRFDLRGVGVMAALFMAANPWLILFDRRLWAHIQVAFSVALLLLAWDVIVVRRRWAAFWFPVLAVLQLLSHVLALVQGLSWLGAWLSAPGRWWRRETALGLAVGFALLLPYGWALVDHQQRTDAGAPAPGSAIDWPSPWWEHLLDPHDWTAARQLATGTGISSTLGLMETENAWWHIARTTVAPLLLLLIAGGALYLISRAARRNDAGTGARLLLLWAVGPLLFLGLQPAQIYFQYWTVLLPLPALYAALGLCALGTVASRVVPARTVWGVVGAITGAILVIWIGGYAARLQMVDAGVAGVPLRTWQQVTGAARNLARAEGTQEVRVAVRGVDPGYDGEPAAVATLIGNPPFARFVAPTSPPALLLSYDRPSLYLWTIDAPQTEARLRQLGEQVWEMSMAPGRPLARIYRLPPADGQALNYTPLEPAPVFDAGMMLLGYRFPENARADEPVPVTLVWRVLEPPPPVRGRDFTAFNHILDAGGEMAAQVDGLALLSRDWWPGDVLIQPYQVQLPPGEYTWRVGLYSRVDGGRAITADGRDAVDVPGLVVR
jgi:hypothetical protein